MLTKPISIQCWLASAVCSPKQFKAGILYLESVVTQLLAKIFGSKVYPGAQPELGVGNVDLTEELMLNECSAALPTRTIHNHPAPTFQEGRTVPICSKKKVSGLGVGRTLGTEPESPFPELNSDLSETHGFKFGWQCPWIDKHQRIAQVKDSHQQRLHAVHSSESSTWPQHSECFAEKALLECSRWHMVEHSE